MPSLYHLNPHPHPFWDFVANLDDHPFFAAYAPRDQQAPNARRAEGASSQAAPQPSENARGKQPAAEDPPVVDPSTVSPDTANDNMPGGFPSSGPEHHHGFHGFGPGYGGDGRRGHGCRGRRGFGGRGNPFGPGPNVRGNPFDPDSNVAGHPFGPGPNFAAGPPPFFAGPRHSAHPRGHRNPPWAGNAQEWFKNMREQHEAARKSSGSGFNLSEFLNDLGNKLGIDLAGAAENLGLDKHSAPNVGEDVDFEPRTDIFDTANNYIIHLSLPGAKKSDVGVDWDGEHSVLRITGVVHRPEVDEQMLSQLVVNGRKRENGVFEKAIRLGTKRDPANVDVAGITAKMADGVLVVKVPKTEPEVHKREVPISGSTSPGKAGNEKDLLFDADEEMYDAPRRFAPEAAGQSASSEKEVEAPAEPQSKEREAREDRSVTAGREDEELPAYAAFVADEDDGDKMSDWEKDSEEEADYVKINVE